MAGLIGLVATRTGAYDEGGIMRRLDWFDLYGLLGAKWIGGGIRRANYVIFSGFVLIGVIILVARLVIVRAT